MKRDERLKKLSWDHHHGLVMALRIERELAGGVFAPALYADLLEFWEGGLLPHFRTEGECLLARLIRHLAAGDPTVQRTLDDHLRMAGLVATMRDAAGERVRTEALRAFGNVLRDHIRWEESVLFPSAEQALLPAELDALGAEIDARLPTVVAAPPAPRR